MVFRKARDMIYPPVTTTLNKQFMVPLQRNAHFTGRQKLLSELKDMLVETVPKRWNHRVALYGLGGVGKSQLALEYVYANRDDYEGIYWITAVSDTTILTGFQEIARRNRWMSDPHTDLEPADLAKCVLECLNEQESWLLILDNLDDVSAASRYLPFQSPRKHTLITTRNQHVDSIPAAGLHISVLELDEAVELFLMESQIGAIGDTFEGQTESSKIVQELGFLPLAIGQAAAYIREASRDLFQFLPIYHNNRLQLLQRTVNRNRPYQESVATTWRLSFQQIDENNKDAFKLLRLFSLLNPDGILIEFLNAGKKGLSKGLREVISNPHRFYEALSELERFSLIRRQGQQIIIHRLVQSIIRYKMPRKQIRVMMNAVVGLCETAFPKSRVYSDHGMRLCSRRYQSQVMVPLSIQKIPISFRLGRILHRIGVFLREDGKYQQAVEFLEKAVGVFSKLTARQHHYAMNALADLAWTFQNNGQLNEAAEIEEEVLQICKKQLGEEHLYTAIETVNLTDTYRDQGRYEEIVALLEKISQSRLETLIAAGQPITLRIMTNLADAYWHLERYEDSIRVEALLLEETAQLLGRNHIATLSVMATVGSMYWRQGRLAAAAQIEKKVWRLRKKILGEAHPDTLTAALNLGATYCSQRRFSAAARFEEIALQGRTAALGEHPKTLKAMAHLAVTYRKQRKHEESIRLLESATEIRKRVDGHEHPSTLWTKSLLAMSYRRNGQLAESLSLHESVTEARMRVFGLENAKTLGSLRNAQILRDLINKANVCALCI